MTNTVQPLATSFMIDGRPVPLRLVANARAKRLIVRIDRSGAVVVTAPSKRLLPKALAFAESRKDWIREQLKTAPCPAPFAPGFEIPVRGVKHLIRRADNPVLRSAQIVAAPRPTIHVGGDAGQIARRVRERLVREARVDFTYWTSEFSEILNQRRGRISLRDPRSRWGSCNAKGDLSFSWRLVMAPPHVLEYVAAHECAHLVHMDHSPAFWRTVGRLVEDMEPAKAWLRENGARLHAYGS
ncbi:MAG: SprT family zinc-dependent metalloprotease [Pseudomonadota bacterium]